MIKELDILELLQKQLAENIYDKTKENIIYIKINRATIKT